MIFQTLVNHSLIPYHPNQLLKHAKQHTNLFHPVYHIRIHTLALGELIFVCPIFVGVQMKISQSVVLKCTNNRTSTVYVYIQLHIHAIIVSVSRTFCLVSNFTQLHALTLGACSCALLVLGLLRTSKVVRGKVYGHHQNQNRQAITCN